MLNFLFKSSPEIQEDTRTAEELQLLQTALHYINAATELEYISEHGEYVLNRIDDDCLHLGWAGKYTILLNRTELLTFTWMSTDAIEAALRSYGTRRTNLKLSKAKTKLVKFLK